VRHCPYLILPAASQTLKKDALEELAAFCKSPEYHDFIKKLIVQGLIKIEEDVVEVHARVEDHAIVKRMVRGECIFCVNTSFLSSTLPLRISWWYQSLAFSTTL
jgi:hypothetical protein